MGGLGGAIAAAVIDEKKYDDAGGCSQLRNITHIVRCGFPYATNIEGQAERTSSEQALNQFGACMISVLMAIVGGLCTGCIAKVIQIKVDPMDQVFIDKPYWHSGWVED